MAFLSILCGDVLGLEPGIHLTTPYFRLLSDEKLFLPRNGSIKIQLEALPLEQAKYNNYQYRCVLTDIAVEIRTGYLRAELEEKVKVELNRFVGLEV